MDLEKTFVFSFSYYKSFFKFFAHDKSMGAKDHWGVINLDLMGMVGRIYVGDH